MGDDLKDIAQHTISRSPITTAELEHEIETLGSRWSIDGPDLKLVLQGPMAKAGKVAAYAGELADALDHHPHIVIDYQRFELTIHTHDMNAITVLDLVYAARLEQWLRSGGWD
ncbi:MAG: 4a-hydroxytetrahydrobiopterin dehydratase [Kofleriaceae bacterium]|nr:4a-hydroxytetrahydrobiopterin dehydratase [Kofleriaceae bacterium]